MAQRSKSERARLLCGAATVALSLWASTASAQDSQEINIAPQSLATALYSFASQTGDQVMFSPELIGAKLTEGVSGVDDPQTALALLLTGTGLTYQRKEDGYLIVRLAPDPQSGSAAGGGAEVEALIVTAQKREEDIQDVPIAISAFTQEDLTRSQVAGGPDLMTQVPNMTFTKTNFTSYSIQIRGIGTQAISATTDPAVAVAFNNTPFIANRFFEQEFYDLERVEVLRGPQGTLYGRNATAGVVNVISAKPKFTYEAKAAADLTNYGSHRLEGMINIPLVEDVVALRLAGAWTRRDGFVKNILTGEQTDGRDLWSGRVSLAIEPREGFRADLIYEHFEENDDRLRSGKQLCKRDPGPEMVGGVPVPESAYPLTVGLNYLSQGCLPASLYSPESFQTPNGYALAYYGPAGALGSPVDFNLDPYANSVQSRDLREIETHIRPEYVATADLVEMQLNLDLSDRLVLASETAFSRDSTFSYQDFNRFDTTPGVFIHDPAEPTLVSPEGIFCDPQVGCTDRLAAADLATARSQQFSQEFRLSSDFEGPVNFSLGANFLRYDTEVKYYVFINSLTAFVGGGIFPWEPGVSTNAPCFEQNVNLQSSDAAGYVWSNPDRLYDIGSGFSCPYIDPNDIHNLNEQGRNYFLSKNPYSLLSYATFGELYYNIAENLKLTAGFRWTVDRKAAPQHPSWLLARNSYGTAVRKVVEQEWREPTGRVAIDWKPDLSFTDETLVYGSYVRGYKAGGANPPPPVAVVYSAPKFATGSFLEPSLTHPEAFDPEFVNAYEIGTKNSLMDGRLTLNMGAFYYDYTGYQISQIVNRSAVNQNFDARVWGVELEADWTPMENLRFGLKVGYEDTRLADGSQAIDLMDRAAGKEGWLMFKPFPPMPSNCVLPVWLVEANVGLGDAGLCSAYILDLDPFTHLPYVANPTQYRDDNGTLTGIIRDIEPSTVVRGMPLFGYPGYDPSSANNGEGFFKDLSGNELPNAPNYTATLTADWTLPLAREWLMTLHTDLYYQSEAWTRVFNTEGYDKLKAFTNVNLAAIFTNEDAGWNVMAYVKNVFDRDSITGAFLNSDDTGLTTNVFLTEPRLYGIRVTKEWSGGAPWGGLLGDGDGPYPLRVELGGYHGPFRQDHERLDAPTLSLFTPDFPFPYEVQDDLDWGSAGGTRLSYRPGAGAWSFNAGIRYGRASGEAEAHPRKAAPGGNASYFFELLGYSNYYIDPGEFWGAYNYATTTARNEESHAIVDFLVGKDFGLGAASSTISAGLRYAHLKSTSQVELHGRPDLYFPPEDVFHHGGKMHRVHGELTAGREFEGAGVAASSETSWPLFGDPGDTGRLTADVGIGGALLWGKQTMQAQGEVRGDYVGAFMALPGLGPSRYYIETPYVAPISEARSKSVTIPSINLSLGLSYELGRTKISGGYRYEKFFDAIDGGIEERKTFDRDFEGPYFKVSVGFGS